MVHRYELTFDDFLAAQRLHIQCDSRLRVWFFLWQRILPFVALAAAALMAWDIAHRHFQFSPATGGALGAVVWLGLYPILVRPYQLRRAFKRLRPDLNVDRHPVELELHEEELVSRVPNRSEGRFHRNAILKFLEDDQIALLYIREKVFIFIPKRALPEDAWTDLRAWYGDAHRC